MRVLHFCNTWTKRLVPSQISQGIKNIPWKDRKQNNSCNGPNLANLLTSNISACHTFEMDMCLLPQRCLTKGVNFIRLLWPRNIQTLLSWYPGTQIWDDLASIQLSISCWQLVHDNNSKDNSTSYFTILFLWYRRGNTHECEYVVYERMCAH